MELLRCVYGWVIDLSAILEIGGVKITGRNSVSEYYLDSRGVGGGVGGKGLRRESRRWGENGR